MDVLTVRDWRTPKWVEHPCPVCKTEMKKTMVLPGYQVFECQESGCTGREVLGDGRKHV